MAINKSIFLPSDGLKLIKKPLSPILTMAKTLRQDITGLRAIAVLAVTLFHIDHVMLPQINLFKGGFLGVDIFFVISGFLMTLLIMRMGGGSAKW